MTTAQRPMAFYHQDGIVPAWNFAQRYAGPNGRIATLPDVVEARLATEPGDLPWEQYFITSTAEYFGWGADGRQKLIVAHGVGPMSTIDGIKGAYSWEYKDKNRGRHGGRISAEEFLKLEAGAYGRATVLESAAQFRELNPEEEHPVFVIDFINYLEMFGEHAFCFSRVVSLALLDFLLLARFGLNGLHYIADHRKHALKWHEERSLPLVEAYGPRIILNQDAPNCPYLTYKKVDGQYDWSRLQPRQLEDGKAVAHLISIGGLACIRYSDREGLMSEVSCHEWRNGARFLAVPEGTDWSEGIDEAPSPSEVLRQRWQELMQPVAAGSYVPQRLYRIEQLGGNWFTRYPKLSDAAGMDESDIEFHVRSVRLVGEKETFKAQEDFSARYTLSWVIAIAPVGANAYSITSISPLDSKSLAMVTIQFYDADIDMSQRLPRADEIKQNYDLLMG